MTSPPQRVYLVQRRRSCADDLYFVPEKALSKYFEVRSDTVNLLQQYDWDDLNWCMLNEARSYVVSWEECSLHVVGIYFVAEKEEWDKLA